MTMDDQGEATRAARPRSALGGRRAVVLIVALHLALLSAYSLLSPMLQSPDEPAHADLALSVLDASGYPEPGTRFTSRQVIASRNVSGYNKSAVDRVLEEARPRPRPPLNVLADDTPTADLNAATQHPPLYYVSAGSFVAVTSAAVSTVGVPSHDQVFLLMRLFNILLILPVPFLVHAAVRRLGGSEGGAILGSLTVLTIPQFTYIGSSINNDNGVTLAFAVLTLLLARVVTGDLTTRTAVLVGLTSAGASLTKVFGVVSIPWIVAAYVVAAVGRDGWRRTVRPGVVSLTLALGLGGSWYARNLLESGSLQPLVRDRTPPAGFVPDFAEWLPRYASRIAQSFWGNFGFLDAPVSGWLVVLASAVLLVGLLVSSVRSDAPLLRRAVLVAPIAMIVLGNAVQHWATIYPRVGGFAGSQGRYLFAAVAPALALIGLTRLSPLATRWVTVGVLGFAGVMHAEAVRVLLFDFWGMENGLSYAARNVVAWSPLPSMATTLVLLSVPVAGALVAWDLSSRSPEVAQA